LMRLTSSLYTKSLTAISAEALMLAAFGSLPQQ
jgi:hypothetical protein